MWEALSCEGRKASLLGFSLAEAILRETSPPLWYEFPCTFSCSYRFVLSVHRQMMWGEMGCANPREDHPKELCGETLMQPSTSAQWEVIITIFI